MKCPKCGGELPPNSKFCVYCGSQITYDMRREQEQVNKQGCPRCGSSNVQFQRENQGEMHNANSRQVFNRTVGLCKDCGFTWYPNVAYSAPSTKKNDTLLWVLGWLFFFPAPVMVLIWRKKNTWEVKTKLIVTVVFWLMLFFISLFPYILMAFTGDKYVTYNTRTKADETTVVAEETTTAVETTIADKIIIETTMAETAETTAIIVESTESKDLYDSQFKNDFVALTKDYDAEIFSDWDLIASKDGSNCLVAGVLIENNEDVVNGFLDKLKTLISDSDECDSAIITIGDKAKGEDGDVLLVASIEDGEIQTNMENINYNSARNKWIREQFSAWDGSHREMTKLIKKNLNDEVSYKHIETTYRDIKTQADADEVNKVLSSAGKKDTVKVGDLFIVTQFSAKNGFNATIKNTAYGIASYSNNSIKLIAIE